MMLQVTGLTVVTSRGAEILHDLNLSVERGEILAVFGPSGSGKSTLLNAICGFIDIEQSKGLLKARAKWFGGATDQLRATGSVTIAGEEMSAIPVERRPIGLVQQKFSAYPHMTAYANIAFPLRCRAIKGQEIDKSVREAAQLAGVNVDRLSTKVKSLSGGEAQRVAIAKMLAKGARVALMDEPFSHLDQIRRSDLISLMRSLVGATDIGRMDALVLISHDWREIRYADKAVLLNARSDGHRIARIFERDPETQLFDFEGATGVPYDDAELTWIAGLSAAAETMPEVGS